ncbi:hypothetical protein [Streptomyces sp. ODS28]|uniref:hypothetical protein n=1 Tax=Streptomyces sp. ODS28 TaxID=3136688 RepID=UPI0031ED56CA
MRIRLVAGAAALAAAAVLGHCGTAAAAPSVPSGPCKTIDLEKLGSHSVNDPALKPGNANGCDWNPLH